jgi:3-hydroxybutyryl-CoA dehydrogenase
MKIKKIGVLGAGTMGSGITQVLTNYGFQVIVVDTDKGQFQKMLDLIQKNCDFLIQKAKKMSVPEKKRLLGNITTSTDIGVLTDVDLVIEAASEDPNLKRKIFGQLDYICPPGVILASNTSSVDIDSIAEITQRPSNVIGMHFMNPVPRMPGVEIILGKKTSEKTLMTVINLSEKLGKTPTVVNNSAGFVANRILMPLINEAINCINEMIATIEGVDQIAKTCLSHPMGPLTLADVIGLDVTLSILQIMQEKLGDKFTPSPLLVKMVKDGYHGNKTPDKGGFYKNGIPNNLSQFGIPLDPFESHK